VFDAGPTIADHDLPDGLARRARLAEQMLVDALRRSSVVIEDIREALGIGFDAARGLHLLLTRSLPISPSLYRTFFDLELVLTDTQALLGQLELGAKARGVTTIDNRSWSLIRGLNRLNEFTLKELRAALARPPRNAAHLANGAPSVPHWS
jgi:hypothetical protein